MEEWTDVTIDNWAKYWSRRVGWGCNSITMSGLFIIGKQLQEQTALLRSLVDKETQDPEDEFHD
jgi:hypothetical protein